MDASARPASPECTSVGRMALGDHLCLVFDGEPERRAVVGTFVRDGLDACHKILYVADPELSGGPGEWLRSLDRRVTAALRSGQLEVRCADQVYLADGARATARIASEVEKARLDGHAGLRVTGEMSWVHERTTPIDRLGACERAVQSVFRSGDVMAICQYGRRLFAPGQLADAQRWHAGRVGVDDLYDDGQVRITPTFTPTGLALSGEVDMAVSGALQGALARCLEEIHGDVHLDLSGLRFCDLTGLRSIMDAAARLAERHRLIVVHHGPDHLLKVLRIAGLSDLPGLLWEEAGQ